MLLSGVKAAVLTVSDSCAGGCRQDESGDALMASLTSSGAEVIARDVVADNLPCIKEKLMGYCDEMGVDLVLTTGGTGLGPRDVTPEATAAVLEKQAAGIAELMRSEGRKSTPRAVLSRGLAGIRKKSLIINLPGSLKGALESWAAFVEIVPHALGMVRGDGHS